MEILQAKVSADEGIKIFNPDYYKWIINIDKCEGRYYISRTLSAGIPGLLFDEGYQQIWIGDDYA